MSETKKIGVDVSNWFMQHQQAIKELNAKQVGALEVLRLVYGVDDSFFMSDSFDSLVKREPAPDVAILEPVDSEKA